MYRFRNVCDVIVPNDLCVGCGVCVGICPANVLAMTPNDYGEYVPAEVKEGCLPRCTRCLDACPFWDQAENEDTLAEALFGGVRHMRYRVEAGFFLDCYSGYSADSDHRISRSSGGLATWLLERLLEERIVDKVVCVVPGTSGDRMHAFAILDRPELVRRSSRSSYYPVEMGSVLRHIEEEEGRYAIVGLPCFIKGIRLAARSSRRLRQRVAVLVGLVCGQSKSKFFVEYVAALGGGNPHTLGQVQFRVKDPQRPATDYGFMFQWEEAGEHMSSVVFWTEGIGQAWRHDYFKLNACDFCDDVFAETADVAFMDARLPEYRNDFRGRNLVITRSGLVGGLLRAGSQDGELILEQIDVERVLESQRALLRQKHQAMQYRLAKSDSLWLPMKRRQPAVTGSLLDQQLWRLKREARSRSRRIWLQTNKDLQLFQDELRWTDMRIRAVDSVARAVRAIKEGRVRRALWRRVGRIWWERGQWR